MWPAWLATLLLWIQYVFKCQMSHSPSMPLFVTKKEAICCYECMTLFVFTYMARHRVLCCRHADISNIYPQEPWSSLPALLPWALLLLGGQLWQRQSLSAGCTSAGTAVSQGACQSSPAGGSTQLCTGPVQRPTAVLPVNVNCDY